MRPNELSDGELIRLIREEKDQRAFVSLVERHRSSCRRLLFAVCGGDDYLVDEAEQEVYISLEKALEQFRGDASFRTFFFRLVRNRGIDTVRREKRRSFVSLSFLAEKGEEPASRENTPEEELLIKEERERLRRVLGKLKEEERTILVLKDRNGLSYEEISRIIGRPVGTVRSRLHRARAKAASLGRREV